MGYADLKNYIVFRKVFGKHPRVLAGLLNDLLDRSGERAIVEIEYLPGEQVPPALGLKMSIVDARCREVGGATFIVEMQVLHVTGFLNRAVYNACRTHVGALKRGAAYGDLVDVMAVSICDFTLWPDAERDAASQPRVPLVSRWSMSEHASGARSMGQVQYVFMELPKLGDHVPGSANERWAALFSHAQDLEPRDVEGVSLTEAQREALDLAREETFSPLERDAIERAHEEVDQVRRTIEEKERARAAAEAKVASAEAKAAAEASARADAETRAAAEASARADAETRAVDAEAKAVAEARARADAEAKIASAEAKAAEIEARLRALEAALTAKRDER